MNENGRQSSTASSLEKTKTPPPIEDESPFSLRAQMHNREINDEVSDYDDYFRRERI